MAMSTTVALTTAAASDVSMATESGNCVSSRQVNEANRGIPIGLKVVICY